MLFIAKFEDGPDRRVLRTGNLQSHVQWLAEHRDAVLMAGSLREKPGADPVGGLWVVEASSVEEILELVKADPFWKAGLRKRVEVLHWSIS